MYPGCIHRSLFPLREYIILLPILLLLCLSSSFYIPQIDAQSTIARSWNLKSNRRLEILIEIELKKEEIARNWKRREKIGKKFLSPFEPEIPFNETNETPLDRCSYYPVNERNCLGSGLWRIPRNSRWKTVKGLKRRKKLGGK